MLLHRKSYGLLARTHRTQTQRRIIAYTPNYYETVYNLDGFMGTT